MIKLSRKLEYSLMVLKHLDFLKQNSRELVSAKDLSLHFQVPFDVVSKVLQSLNQNQVVKSTAGVHGGYQLIRELNSLTLYELAEMIEGPLYLVKCLSGDCEIKDKCSILSPIQLLNQKLSLFLKTILISDLISPYQDLPLQKNSLIENSKSLYSHQLQSEMEREL